MSRSKTYLSKVINEMLKQTNWQMKESKQSLKKTLVLPLESLGKNEIRKDAFIRSVAYVSSKGSSASLNTFTIYKQISLLMMSLKVKAIRRQLVFQALNMFFNRQY